MSEALTDTQLPRPIPVTIISGFLGAGKTTVLNHILSQEHGLRAAVLVNDFGAINIDAKLVVGVEDDTVSLANGCICCSIRDDLIGACLGLLQRSEPPEHVIIEASGVSNPLQIAATFQLPELQMMLALDSILCVVDCDQFSSLVGDSADLVRAQISAADMLILNKIDLVDDYGLEHVKTAIRGLAPNSPFLEATNGSVPIALVFGAGSHQRFTRTRTELPLHSDSESHRQFSSMSWTCDRPLSLQKLRKFFESLPNSIYRAKGILYLQEVTDFQIILQKVGKRSSLKNGQRWGSLTPHTELLLIGINGGIDRPAMKSGLDECIYNGDDELAPLMRRMRDIASNSASFTD